MQLGPNQKARQTNDSRAVLFHGLGIPANPAIAARQIEGRRTKTKGTHHLRTGQNKVTQLRSHQRSSFERMLTADEPVPNEVLRVLRSGNEAQMQIADLLDRLGQLG